MTSVMTGRVLSNNTFSSSSLAAGDLMTGDGEREARALFTFLFSAVLPDSADIEKATLLAAISKIDGTPDASLGAIAAEPHPRVRRAERALVPDRGRHERVVEYSIATSTGAVKSAYLEIVGGGTVPLSLAWNKWQGKPSARLPTGTSVVVHAESTSGKGLSDVYFAAKP